MPKYQSKTYITLSISAFFYFFQNSIDQQVEKVSKVMIPRNILLFKEEKKMIYVCSLKISDLRQSRQSLVSHHFAEGNGGGGGGSGGGGRVSRASRKSSAAPNVPSTAGIHR